MPQRDTRPRQPEPRPEPVAPLPVKIRFFPSQKALGSVAHQIRGAKKAYPLSKLALLFLSKPDYSFVRIESGAGSSGVSMYQCRTCRTVALDRPALVSHIFKAHLDEYFDKEETLAEAPAGQFVCIAKCARTGVLLGPPNHHSYAGKLEEVRRTRFPNLSLDEYKKRIEVLHDAALIEQWKEESRKQTVYRLKVATGDKNDPISWTAAETYMTEHIVPSLIDETRRAHMPAKVAAGVEDPRLVSAMTSGLRNEKRSPLSMMLALRMAFRNMHLHVFRSGRGNELVSTIQPAPFDWAHAISGIQAVAAYLREHPACQRESLAAALPAEASASLSWLIEKGHIVELYDGTLMMPFAAHRATRAADMEEKKGEQEPSVSVSPEEPVTGEVTASL